MRTSGACVLRSGAWRWTGTQCCCCCGVFCVLSCLQGTACILGLSGVALVPECEGALIAIYAVGWAVFFVGKEHVRVCTFVRLHFRVCFPGLLH